MASKMHLLNDVSPPPNPLHRKDQPTPQAINEIGWTALHWKLFALNGFGYAVDSLVAILQCVIADQAFLEIGNGGFANGLTIALYSGLLVGALF